MSSHKKSLLVNRTGVDLRYEAWIANKKVLGPWDLSQNVSKRIQFQEFTDPNLFYNVYLKDSSHQNVLLDFDLKDVEVSKVIYVRQSEGRYIPDKIPRGAKKVKKRFGNMTGAQLEVCEAVDLQYRSIWKRASAVRTVCRDSTLVKFKYYTYEGRDSRVSYDMSRVFSDGDPDRPPRSTIKCCRKDLSSNSLISIPCFLPPGSAPPASAIPTLRIEQKWHIQGYLKTWQSVLLF